MLHLGRASFLLADADLCSIRAPPNKRGLALGFPFRNGRPKKSILNSNQPISEAQKVPLGNHMAVGQNQRYHFGVGAPPILAYFSGWIGMFTGGTIWVLIHGHMSKARLQVAGRLLAEATFGSHQGPWKGRQPYGTSCLFALFGAALKGMPHG